MKKNIKIFQVDTFTNELFAGNSAAVCILDEGINDELMQEIATENNLSETAFVVKKNNDFEIRWFTPTTEVDLCGHATLASAHILFNHEVYIENEISFLSPRSGILKVKKTEDQLTLIFPIDPISKTDPPKELINGLGVIPLETYKGKTDYMLILSSEKEVKEAEPDFKLISEVEARGIIITAKGNEVDFVSRFFAPQSGIDEDPVTGSSHTTLTPYWAAILGKNELLAKQLSKRGGSLKCKLIEDHVEISGNAKTYLTGLIHLE